jgi:pimeloyl-ACP methyl ester carboxylesterase
MGTSDRLNEIWYQSFHQMPMAPALVGASRDTCRAYIGHFLRHWAHRKDAFDDVLEDWVDNFLRPGNLEGGFAYYRAAHAGRMAMIAGRAAAVAPIPIRTCVRWAEHDAIFPLAWADRLEAYFSDLDFAPFPGVGHFPHREDPDGAAAQIGRFFAP